MNTEKNLFNNLIETGKAELTAEAGKEIKYILTELETVKNLEKQFKEELFREMQEQGIYKIETEDVSICIARETTRETIDSKRLKEVYEEVYNDCVRITPVKANLRIKLKGGSED